ncbi:MAG: metal-sulfur cluster assembly factor [Calditrichaeota bacterium]|nr:MAG: metal-sulfur cluster assembly factor [Calditrichota bacterium]MBL1207527.1 metal-sulfur cluster assembly factor [Calditrichota bacterium]NOG47359.1 metal-sulfur cluster assembly factor [Calditrichota bacterium]
MFEVDKHQILDTLKEVIDPELGVDIVNLGLIYSVDIDDNNIRILMTMTTPSCPMHTYLTTQTAQKTEKLCPWAKVEVKLVWDPPWDANMMSDEAKKMFGK